MSTLLEQLKKIVIFSAYFGEIGCPDDWGFGKLDYPDKTCVNSDCQECWRWAIEQVEKGEQEMKRI